MLPLASHRFSRPSSPTIRSRSVPSFDCPVAGAALVVGSGRIIAGHTLDMPEHKISAYLTRALCARRSQRVRCEGRDVTLTPIDQPFVGGLIVPAEASGASSPGSDPLEKVKAWSESAMTEATRMDPFLRLESSSPSLAPLLDRLRKIAGTSISILVLGETGSGKEVVAGAIHEASGRPGRFVAENCAALPDGLLEAEMFGVERGAFTGAVRREGRFQQAHRGTLFLDEIGDLPLSMQVKLLRALQEGVIRRLGANVSEQVDVRVVTATHKSLSRQIDERVFRQDLYYRIAGISVEIPPLRRRPGDIPFLAATLMSRAAAEGLGPGRGFSPEVLRRLSHHAFEGNVRELDNIIRRSMALATSARIDFDQLPHELTWLENHAEVVEADMIRQALTSARGIKSDAARRLGWTRAKLYRRIEALGVCAVEKREPKRSGS